MISPKTFRNEEINLGEQKLIKGITKQRGNVKCAKTFKNDFLLIIKCFNNIVVCEVCG